METLKEKILIKAQKLLAMTKSNNENEIANATLLLKQLLDKYNIDINQIKLIKNKKEDIIKTFYDFGNSMQNWEVLLSCSIANFYDCKSLFDKHNKKITIIGFPVDVKITLQVFDYVSQSFEIICRKEMSIATIKKGFRQSFFTGAVNSLANRLEQMKLSSTIKSNCNELIVLKQVEINNFIDEEYGKLKNKKLGLGCENREGYISGKETGKNISLNQQITH